MLTHGGRLNKAVQQYNIPHQDWIDLSTAINPNHWPMPVIPIECFTRLPEDDDGLIEAAEQYYKVKNILPVAGSQAAIQLLPRLRKKSRVAVPEIGYAEHAYQWQMAGHEVVSYTTLNIDNVINDVDVVIVINPNNPTGVSYTQTQLMIWHKKLQYKQGWLIVDEAFIDAEEISSLVNMTHQSGLIVMRSIGKFFGLAGIRSGFVFAEQNLLEEINERLGPWALTGVSRYITTKALSDNDWILRSKRILKRSSESMDNLIYEYTDIDSSGTYLFKTIIHEQAERIAELFAMNGILVRLLDNKKGLRFGLPSNENWQKVEGVFKSVFNELYEENKSSIRKIS